MSQHENSFINDEDCGKTEIMQNLEALLKENPPDISLSTLENIYQTKFNKSLLSPLLKLVFPDDFGIFALGASQNGEITLCEPSVTAKHEKDIRQVSMTSIERRNGMSSTTAEIKSQDYTDLASNAWLPDDENENWNDIPTAEKNQENSEAGSMTYVSQNNKLIGTKTASDRQKNTEKVPFTSYNQENESSNEIKALKHQEDIALWSSVLQVEENELSAGSIASKQQKNSEQSLSTLQDQENKSSNEITALKDQENTMQISNESRLQEVHASGIVSRELKPSPNSSNFGKNSEQHLPPVGNNVSKAKSKEDYGVFNKTVLKTLISCAEEQNKTRERTKKDSNSSSGQNHGQNRMKSSTYEDEENRKRNTEEILNCQKNSPIPNCEKNKWKENQIPTDSSSRELGPTINNTYSNTMAVNIKRCNDRKYLVFDKPDFFVSSDNYRNTSGYPKIMEETLFFSY